MIPRIYYPHPLSASTLITLDEPVSRHLLTVLRLHPGASLQLFSGDGGAYEAQLQAIQKKRAVIAVGAWVNAEVESPLAIHLAQAISRGERMDFTVQKSVELGVTQITPLLTARCGVHLNEERSQNRVRHWRSIAISASQQSGRCHVPDINPPCDFSDFLTTADGLKFICTPCKYSKPLPDRVPPVSRISLLIGPEGGFSAAETAQAEQMGFYPLQLGPRILRTETAAIVAITFLQSRWGDIP